MKIIFAFVMLKGTKKSIMLMTLQLDDAMLGEDQLSSASLNLFMCFSHLKYFSGNMSK